MAQESVTTSILCQSRFSHPISDEDELPDLQSLLRSCPAGTYSSKTSDNDDTSIAEVIVLDTPRHSICEGHIRAPDSADSFKSARSRWTSPSTDPATERIHIDTTSSLQLQTVDANGNFDLALQNLEIPSSPSDSPTRWTAKGYESLLTSNASTCNDPAMILQAHDVNDDIETSICTQSDDYPLQTPARRHGHRIIMCGDTESDSDIETDRRHRATTRMLDGIQVLGESSHNADALLRSADSESLLVYSPPRLSPNKVHKLNLPPLLPSTPKSPARKVRIPKSPFRQSDAAFWDEAKSVAWTELHSPKKVLQPRVDVVLNQISLVSSQSPVKSPKKSAAEMTAVRNKRLFLKEREQRAQDFLDHFIRRVCPEIADKLTGPIEIIWSKTLSSTAGRATYSKSESAKIELSEKVIDSQDRLISTMAHEMCHILVWLMDNQFKNPHGKEFRAHGRKVERLLNIPVDTTHDYVIHYKYQWQCINESCQKIYGRHSKSLDPTKAACGLCHGRLLQILPKPRMNEATNASPVKSGGLNKYQTFLKANIDRVRDANPGLKYAELIKIVAAEYRASKTPDLVLHQEKASSVDDNLVSQLSGMTLIS